MFSRFGETISIARDELRELVLLVLDKAGELRRVLVLPPDHTRLNSITWPITAMVYEKLTGAIGIMDIAGAMVAVEKLSCLCHTVK
jgi:hypothetical protein